MQMILNVAAPVFWGVVVFSILVFVHEGGHFLAARSCGVRVTEFFLGMPCRFNLHHASKRIGTKFGVTPILLGGYAAICGMDPEVPAGAARVLGEIHRRGTASVADLAAALDMSEDEVLDVCAFLLTWGSIAPVYDASKGEGPQSRYYPSTYAALPRDAQGLTIFDGRAFDRAHATKQGEPWQPPHGDDAFLAAERSRTYMGKGFWKRALMLVAGIAVNILTGFILLIAVYSVVGVSTYADVSTVGGVTAGGPAAQAGMVAGDQITAIDGAETTSWEDILQALQDKKAGDEVSITYRHDGADVERDITLDGEGHLGIEASTENVRLNVLDAAKLSLGYIAQTAQGVSQLLMPQHTMEVLDNSTSVVGISVMSAQAAAEGPATLLSFIALISFSLGFMNLLPIPPLDGGKLLIEIIQAVARRPVPTRVQNVISYIGVGLFGLLFIFLLRADILRLI